MVSLSDVRASNAQIPDALPKGLVAVFAGATSGIGEATLLSLVQYAVEPRIYLFARNAESAACVLAACRTLNPGGVYEFVHVDLSSVRETDRACESVKAKETFVNLLVLSAGELSFDGGLTSEGLSKFLAASTYTRLLIAQNLLPLLSTAAATTQLARVVNVAGGTKEGAINTSDIAGTHIPLLKLRPHVTSMHTLAWETLASKAPTIGFVHDFPGAVWTSLHKDVPGFKALLLKLVLNAVYLFLGRWLFVPIGESGERHVFLGTSARYAAREGSANGVKMKDQSGASRGSNGEIGSGVYSVGWDGEGPATGAEMALKRLREKRVRELVWSHFEESFEKARSVGAPL